MKVDAAIALNLLMPRDTATRKQAWSINGWRATFNSRMVSEHEDDVIRALMKDYDKACQKPIVKWVKVVDNDVWFIQRTLRYVTIDYMLKRAFAWQGWRPGRLPIYLKWRGKLVVWNGTHRTLLCMLANKRMRVKLLDLDAFVVWRKAHPNKRMWGVKRVVVFGKGKKRGQRK
jgi:hypothetical protein